MVRRTDLVKHAYLAISHTISLFSLNRRRAHLVLVSATARRTPPVGDVRRFRSTCKRRSAPRVATLLQRCGDVSEMKDFLANTMCTLLLFYFSYLVGWCTKAKGRRTDGTGRMRHMKSVSRRFKNGFREGTTATPKTKAATN